MPPRGRRPAGAPDARAAILDAARELFAQNGFERTTMRGVAERAGVDPALIAHYFGNKDGLLAASVALPVDPLVLLAGLDRQRAGTEIVRRILGVAESSPVVRGQMIALMRTALSHEQAAEAMRAALSRTVLVVVGELVEPDLAPMRAALVGSHLGGLLIGRYALQVPGLADAEPEQLVAAVGPVLQHYLTGSITEVAGRRSRTA